MDRKIVIVDDIDDCYVVQNDDDGEPEDGISVSFDEEEQLLADTWVYDYAAQSYVKYSGPYDWKLLTATTIELEYEECKMVQEFVKKQKRIKAAARPIPAPKVEPVNNNSDESVGESSVQSLGESPSPLVLKLKRRPIPATRTRKDSIWDAEPNMKLEPDRKFPEKPIVVKHESKATQNKPDVKSQQPSPEKRVTETETETTQSTEIPGNIAGQIPNAANATATSAAPGFFLIPIAPFPYQCMPYGSGGGVMPMFMPGMPGCQLPQMPTMPLFGTPLMAQMPCGMPGVQPQQVPLPCMPSTSDTDATVEPMDPVPNGPGPSVNVGNFTPQNFWQNLPASSPADPADPSLSDWKLQADSYIDIQPVQDSPHEEQDSVDPAPTPSQSSPPKQPKSFSCSRCGKKFITQSGSKYMRLKSMLGIMLCDRCILTPDAVKGKKPDGGQKCDKKTSADERHTCVDCRQKFVYYPKSKQRKMLELKLGTPRCANCAAKPAAKHAAKHSREEPSRSEKCAQRVLRGTPSHVLHSIVSSDEHSVAKGKTKTDEREKSTTKSGAKSVSNAAVFYGTGKSIRGRGRPRLHPLPSSKAGDDGKKSGKAAAGIGQFSCPECGKSFKLQIALVQHEKSHAKSKPQHTCAKCHAVLASESALKSHACGDVSPRSAKIKSETVASIGSVMPCATATKSAADKANRCATCGKRFPTFSRLRWHMMTHVDQTAHRCTVCRAVFKRAAQLEVHRKSHKT